MSEHTSTPVRITSSSPFIEPATSFGRFPTPSRLEADRSADAAVDVLEAFTGTSLGTADATADLASMLRSIEEHAGPLPLAVSEALTVVRRYTGVPGGGPTSTARRFMLRRGVIVDPSHCPCNAHVPWHRHG